MAKRFMVFVITLALGAGAAGAMEYAPGTMFFNVGTGVNFSTPKWTSTIGAGYDCEGDRVFAPGASFSFEWLPSGKTGLTYGVETGLYHAGYNLLGRDFSVIAIPILFRLGWHPGFIKVKNLDVYLLGKAGLTTDIYSGDIDDIVERSPFTFSFGGNIGVKYFFTPKIGVFLEAGVNFYNLDHEAVAGSLHTDINNYVTLGVSITRDKKKKD